MTKPRAIQPITHDEVFIVFVATFFAFHICGKLLHPLFGDYSSTVLQWLIVAGVPLAHLQLRRAPIVKTLRLGMPAAKHWLGAVILALGITSAAMLYMLLQNTIFGESERYASEMAVWNERLSSSTFGELAVLFVTVALTPAICEEILFRGHMTRLLQPSSRPAALCVIVGVLFGLFHANWIQVIPAALIGMVFTWVALTTGSLWPSVLIHLIFNSVTIFSHHFQASPEDSMATQIAIVIAIAAVCLPIGYYLLRPVHSANTTGPSRAAAASSEPVTGVNP